MNSPNDSHPPSTRIMPRTADVDAATRLTMNVLASGDVATMHQHFRDGIALLGAERAWFASVDCNGEGFEALCMQSACDPAWTRRYLDESLYRSDAWLSYARRHVEPLAASRLTGLTDEQRSTQELAAAAGFVSCALLPAHAGIDPARFGLLVLGHSRPGYFEAGDFALLRIRGRALALELHGWWIEHRRREKLAAVRLTDDDLVLLELHAKGRNSDEIAAALHVTRQSINSRFQRLNKRLHVPNRRAAAQVALECGLIDGA
jgi:DNA-binding CsgD family transcriptional regulator